MRPWATTIFAAICEVAFLVVPSASAVTLGELARPVDGRGVPDDALEDVFVCGFTRGGLDGKEHGESNVFLSKFTSSGELEWTRQIGTSDGLENINLDDFPLADVGGPDAGGVDAADYIVWREYDDFGIQQLYDAWRSHFGQSVGNGNSQPAQSTPEPASIVMLFLALGGIVPVQRSSRRRK